ncbi:hypothetical protein D9M70_556060 [compost metagenome]
MSLGDRPDRRQEYLAGESAEDQSQSQHPREEAVDLERLEAHRFGCLLYQQLHAVVNDEDGEQFGQSTEDGHEHGGRPTDQ